MEFYITKLDKGYSVVLSYDWLVHHNPAINWAETKVVFPGSVKAPEGPSAPIKPEFNIQFVSTKTSPTFVANPETPFTALSTILSWRMSQPHSRCSPITPKLHLTHTTPIIPP